MTDQHKIWQHFQNAAPESFAASHPRLDWLVRQIARRARHPQPAVLNIGIGDGYFERQARERLWHVQSLDPDQQAVNRLRDGGITAHVGTIDRIPLGDKSLEFVVASEVLEHLSDADSKVGIVEIHRVLRTGGYLMGTVPHAENLAEQQVICPQCGTLFHRWGHHRSFNLSQVREELAPLFTVEKLGRTAFVPVGRGGVKRAIKSLLRIALARLGEPIAGPTIYWIARKK
jgi:SAM-dependent methyltransferase